MSDWSPRRVPRPLAIVTVFYLALSAYAVFVVGELLLAMFVGFLLGVIYLLWRFLVAVEGIAGALQHMAYERE